MLPGRFKAVSIMPKILCGYWWGDLEETCGFLLQNLTEASYKQRKNPWEKLQPFMHPPERIGQDAGFPLPCPPYLGGACEIQP